MNQPANTDSLEDKQVLEKAIQLAKERGWKDGEELLEADYIDSIFEDYKLAHPYFAVTHDTGVNLEAIIYNKEFAKAIAGNYWEQFLQEMVVSEDPIHYLGTQL